MTAPLERGEWSAARPGLLYPWERPGTHCTGGWAGPRASLDGRKISPHRDSIPGPFRKHFCYTYEFCLRVCTRIFR